MIIIRACFLMDVTSGRVIRRIQSHTSKINTVDLNDDGTVLMSGSYDQSVCLWDLRASNRDPLQTLRDCKDSVTSIAHTDQEIIVGCLDKTLRIYDIRRGLCHSDDMTLPITCVRLTHDRKSVLSTCLGGKIFLTDKVTGKLMQTYQGGHIHKNYKLEACMESDDQHIAVCSEDGSICHYNLVSGQVMYSSSQCHSKAVGSISYHPKDKFFVTGSYDGTVKCWSVVD